MPPGVQHHGDGRRRSAYGTIIDTMVSDRVKLSGDAGKYVREATDVLREDVSLQRRGIDIAQKVIALIASYIWRPE
jgi:hypothetical protein